MSSADLGSMAAGWGGALWRASWQGGIVLGLLWVICRLTPRLSPSVHVWLWRLGYAKLFIALLWAAPIVIPILPAKPFTPSFLRTQDDGLIASAAGSSTINSASHSGADWLQSIMWAALAAWAAGLCWSVWRVIAEAHQTAAARRRCTPLEDPEMDAECARLAVRIGLDRTPELCLTAEAASPFLIGFGRPAIVLPQSFRDEYSPEQQRAVLAHELAHLKRGDLAWAWLARAARCLFFFHPLVWLTEMEWQQSQEMACDQEALKLDGICRTTYGETLLQVVQGPRSPLTAGLGVMRIAESYSTVRRRLTAMNETRRLSRRAGMAMSVALPVVALGALVPWKLTDKGQPPADKERVKLAMQQNGDSFLSSKMIQALQLNDTQVIRIKKLHESAMQEVRKTLTPQQLKQLDGIATGMKMKAAGMDLTPGQMKKMEAIKHQLEEQAQAIQADTTLSNEEKEAKMRALKESHMAEFATILTPEQQRRMKLMHEGEMKKQIFTAEQEQQMAEMKMHIAEHARVIENDPSLSPEQKELKMRELKQMAEEHMSQMLSPEQKAALQHEQAMSGEGPFSLNTIAMLKDLKPAQKQRIEAIFRETHRQLGNILTPAQKERFQQLHGS